MLSNSLTGSGPADNISRTVLKDNARELFAGDSEIALFYFAGHGHIETTGGYLCVTFSETGDDGFALDELLTLERVGEGLEIKSSFSTAVIRVLPDPDPSLVSPPNYRKGMTVLTASTSEQYATEENGSGVFTTLFVDALNGAAGNLVGDVTPGSVYAHIDQSLGPWEQRPVFKTNVKSFVSLRKVQAPIDLTDLHRIAELFPSAGFEFSLDPSYEPESDNPDPKNTAVFAILQKYNRVNLAIPLEARHMYHAAMESKACKLTVLGEHYRRLVTRNRI